MPLKEDYLCVSNVISAQRAGSQPAEQQELLYGQGIASNQQHQRRRRVLGLKGDYKGKDSLRSASGRARRDCLCRLQVPLPGILPALIAPQHRDREREKTKTYFGIQLTWFSVNIYKGAFQVNLSANTLSLMT
ncbi:hypothetical protein JZ751_000794 [Albula glossodonta]|uniref:Uncharacterized protein n=1 Tax=Albula glossodonta TaxID=121402 RepID=A0A8T2PX70_9TELE|nr:hypothetical protein JZ751_000794 [Albula glossodonta]